MMVLSSPLVRKRILHSLSAYWREGRGQWWHLLSSPLVNASCAHHGHGCLLPRMHIGLVGLQCCRCCRHLHRFHQIIFEWHFRQTDRPIQHRWHKPAARSKASPIQRTTTHHLHGRTRQIQILRSGSRWFESRTNRKLESKQRIRTNPLMLATRMVMNLTWCRLQNYNPNYHGLNNDTISYWGWRSYINLNVILPTSRRMIPWIRLVKLGSGRSECQGRRRDGMDELSPMYDDCQPLHQIRLTPLRLAQGTNRASIGFLKGTIFDTFFAGQDRAFARFYALATIARVPYFSYLLVLHLFEMLGRWRRHHLLIMEELGGNQHLDRELVWCTS